MQLEPFAETTNKNHLYNLFLPSYEKRRLKMLRYSMDAAGTHTPLI